MVKEETVKFQTMSKMRLVLAMVVLATLFGSACTPVAAPSAAPTTQEAAPQATEAQPAPAAATEATEAPAAAEGETTFIVLVPADTNTLDPAVNYDFSGAPFLGPVYDNLVKSVGTEKAEIVPDLAESWQPSDDGLTWTFKLREGAKFHDGTPVNAEAVKYTFDRLLAMNTGGAVLFASIDKVEAVDDLTVQFILKEPFSGFLASLTSIWGPLIVSPTTVKAHEKDGDWGQAWLTENDAGSGPYKLESWTRNEQMVLVRNPDYWGGWGDKYLDRIIIRYVTETSTQRLIMEKGDADAAVGMSNEDLDALMASTDIVVEEHPAMVIKEVRINTTKKPLDDVRVRQALAYTMDYDQVAEGVLSGHAKRMTSVMAEGVPGYYKPSFMYVKDLDKARQLLAEAGYADGFSLDYIWLTEVPEDRQIGEMWQADLKQVGIDLNVQEMPLNTWWEAQAAPETAPQTMMGAWGLDYADATSQLWAMYYSGNFPPVGSDYYFYKNDRVDELLQQGRAETDQAKLDAIYQEAVEIIYTEAPEIWVVQNNERVALQSNVKGYEYTLSYYRNYFPFEQMYKE
jgi:peptide/nickel transport system substrate-binding protein